MRRFKREKSVHIMVHPEFFRRLENSRHQYSKKSGLDVSTNTRFTEIIARSNIPLVPPVRGGFNNGLSKKRRRF